MRKGFTQPDWLMQAAGEKPDALALIQGDLAWDYETLNIYVGFTSASRSIASNPAEPKAEWMDALLCSLRRRAHARNFVCACRKLSKVRSDLTRRSNR
jgi:hypothetical protein